ncbi:hypothetical protein R6Q59_014176 [Mikania micrantha]
MAKKLLAIILLDRALLMMPMLFLRGGACFSEVVQLPMGILLLELNQGPTTLRVGYDVYREDLVFTKNRVHQPMIRNGALVHQPMIHKGVLVHQLMIHEEVFTHLVMSLIEDLVMICTEDLVEAGMIGIGDLVGLLEDPSLVGQSSSHQRSNRPIWAPRAGCAASKQCYLWFCGSKHSCWWWLSGNTDAIAANNSKWYSFRSQISFPLYVCKRSWKVVVAVMDGSPAINHHYQHKAHHLRWPNKQGMIKTIEKLLVWIYDTFVNRFYGLVMVMVMVPEPKPKPEVAETSPSPWLPQPDTEVEWEEQPTSSFCNK